MNKSKKIALLALSSGFMGTNTLFAMEKTPEKPFDEGKTRQVSISKTKKKRKKTVLQKNSFPTKKKKKRNTRKRKRT